ncbi:MAG: CehA/McbA family metallohydrolase, partial [Myxococcota bacterium]|nr:CehA/McbA family metallohydrolase [Myxococcota bacterium]
IRDQHESDEIIQINHPRGSNISSYFSYVGLDAAQDKVANQAHWTLNWDAIEVFNGNCNYPSTLEDWIGLTNHGHRKTLASGSDSHGEHGLIGTPRNWIQVDEASVREDSQALVAPVRARRLFISCGPFVRFEAVDAAGQTLASLGDLTGVDDQGDVMFHVVVEAPTWITLDEVRLWENGQVIAVADITTSADPIVRFDEVWTATPTADAWYAVEVLGSGSMAPVTWSGSPYALTNPIEVDADGDGEWTAPGSPEN